MKTVNRWPAAAAIAAASVISGCVTQGTVSDEEALANYPQTGIEAMTGE